MPSDKQTPPEVPLETARVCAETARPCSCSFFVVEGEGPGVGVVCTDCGQPPATRLAGICERCDYDKYPWQARWDEGHPGVCPECFADLVLVRDTHPEATMAAWNSVEGRLQRMLGEDAPREGTAIGQPRPAPTTKIRKYVPGEHFHVLGEKFPSHEQAAQYAREQGFEPQGMELVDTHRMCINGLDGRGWQPLPGRNPYPEQGGDPGAARRLREESSWRNC